MLRVMDELISGPAFASEVGGGASPQALQSVILSSSMAAEGTAKTRLLRLPGPGVTIIESPSPVVGVQNVITQNEQRATMVPHCSIVPFLLHTIPVVGCVCLCFFALTWINIDKDLMLLQLMLAGL